MILINSLSNQSYICNQKEVARKIGVSPLTISRWKCSGRKVEIYNHWHVYLKPVKILQNSGFAITKQPLRT